MDPNPSITPALAHAARHPVAASAAAPPALEPPIVERGTCRALFAYDIGLAINLDSAADHIAAAARATVGVIPGAPPRDDSAAGVRRSPKYFEFRPPPLRVTQPGQAISIAGFTTAPEIDCVLWDFGAVSVRYSLPIAGPLSSLLPLSEALYENAALLADSRRRVEALVRAIGPAITKPRTADFVEDYVIYEIGAMQPRCDIGRLIEDQPRLLAQILRSEPQRLSPQEILDALAFRISYAEDDAAVIDWNASMVFQHDAEDVRAVLEFANVELLEMRFLDNLLDESLDEAYQAVARREARGRFRTALRLERPGAELHRIARLQMDSALLFEGVNNALKLLGDQYLARVYRLASQRLHLPEWDASIMRKLSTLESIYQKASDRQTGRRMEILEWIIIILIALEIVLSLLPRASLPARSPSSGPPAAPRTSAPTTPR